LDAVKDVLVSRLRSGESRVINSSGSIGLGGTSWGSSICNRVNRAGIRGSQTDDNVIESSSVVDPLLDDDNPKVSSVKCERMVTE
jgi:hypothetical protein